MVYTVSLLVPSVLFFLASLSMEIVEWRAIPIYVAAFVIREYSFWIVKSFVQELRAPKGFEKAEFIDESYVIDMTLKKVSTL